MLSGTAAAHTRCLAPLLPLPSLARQPSDRCCRLLVFSLGTPHQVRTARRAASTCSGLLTEACAHVQFQEITFYIGSEEHTDTIKQYLEHNFAYHTSWKWPSFVLSLVFSLVLRFTVSLATKFINFQKR
jgi:hypothetical protein